MKKILLFSLLFLILSIMNAGAALPLQRSFAPLVKSTSPSVVNIYTKRVVTESARAFNPFFNDPFFNQFFGHQRLGGGVRQRIENSLGSGVMVDGNDGLIATSHHVIKDATEIRVVTSEGIEFSAEKILEDPRTDLAILRIEDKNIKLPTITIADSDDVEVGDIVLAIGNPFGVGQTVTSGIVSGVARTDVGITDYSFFIQTDAAINPGNSGGALIDIDGRLIGINTAIYSRSGGSMGIGFAIPSNMVTAVVRAAKTGGRVVRAWMGVSSQEITQDMVENLQIPRAKGALINGLHNQSPAKDAGLQVGDVVVSVNGKEVSDPEALKFRLATVAIGEKIEMVVVRKGREVKISMTAQPAPETVPRDETLIKDNNILFGTVVANISPALLDEFPNISEESGVVVIEVQARNISSLRVGDIIISINDKEVKDVKNLLNILKENENSRQWKAVVKRGKATLTLNVIR